METERERRRRSRRRARNGSCFSDRYQHYLRRPVFTVSSACANRLLPLFFARRFSFSGENYRICWNKYNNYFLNYFFITITQALFLFHSIYFAKKWENNFPKYYKYIVIFIFFINWAWSLHFPVLGSGPCSGGPRVNCRPAMGANCTVGPGPIKHRWFTWPGSICSYAVHGLFFFFLNSIFIVEFFTFFYSSLFNLILE